MGVSLEVYRTRIGRYVNRENGGNRGNQPEEADELFAGGGLGRGFLLSIPPGLACLALLVLMLSAQCQALLLVMGSVERNPGPTTPLDVLALLCAEAPTSEIRDCLKLYDHQKHLAANKKNLSSVSKKTLNDTMTYLGVSGQDGYVKGTVVHNLICRIQNLLPETCAHCEETYCVGRSDLELLSCRNCDQSFHTPCLLSLLGIGESERDSLGPRDVLNKINPFSLPGIVYLCRACEAERLPSDEVGKKKKKAPESLPQEVADNQSDAPGDSATTGGVNEAVGTPGNQQGGEILPNPDQVSPHRPHNTQGNVPRRGNKRPVPRSHNAGSANGTQICPFYRKGICRYGVSGRGCSKSHPSKCKKLLAHGTRDSRGCSKGANCEKFHPVMCPSSIQSAVCTNKSCKLTHVRGTRRSPSKSTAADTNPVQQQRNGARGTQQQQRNGARGTQQQQRNGARGTHQNPTNNHEVDFLAAIAALKKELLEVMDIKFRAVHSAAAGQTMMGTTLPNYPWQQLHHHPNQGMNQAYRVPTPTQIAF